VHDPTDTPAQIFDDDDYDAVPAGFFEELSAKHKQIKAEAECNYASALVWLERGFNVVPKDRDEKHPGVLWAYLQEQRVTKDDLREWFWKFASGVGLITGTISGVIVVDIDGEVGEALLAEFQALNRPFPETLTIRSGSRRGLHRYFKHPGYPVKTKSNTEIKIDIKGDGGFAVLPPTLHKSGGRYEVVVDAKPAELPKGLLEFIEAKAAAAKKAAQGAPRVLGAGNGALLMNMPPQSVHSTVLGTNIVANVFDKPPPVEVMRGMLTHLNERGFFANRDGIQKDDAGVIFGIGWVQCGMAQKVAYGDKDGFDLWAITHRDDEARNDAPEQPTSDFASPLALPRTRKNSLRPATIVDRAQCRKNPAVASQARRYASLALKENGDGMTLVARIEKPLPSIAETIAALEAQTREP
jgi:hypothetical protein